MSHPHLGGKAGTGPYQYGKPHTGNSSGRAPGQVTQNAWVTDDALDMSVNMARTNYNWAGVPIYMKHGKRLQKTMTQICRTKVGEFQITFGKINIRQIGTLKVSVAKIIVWEYAANRFSF